MKVLFVIDHLDSGGAPIVVRDLLVGMVKRGVAVTLVVLSERVKHCLPDGVTVVRLPFVPADRLERWRRYRLHARKLDAWLANREADDLVVAHLHHAHQVVARSRLGEQSWYCLHSDPVTAFLGNKSGVGRWRKRHKVRKLYSGKRLAAVSAASLQRLKAGFGVRPRDESVVYNPLDLVSISQKMVAPVAGTPERYLVFAGRMDLRAKRFDRLLDAYQASETELPLVLVGGGGQETAVDALINQRGLGQRVLRLGHRENPYPYIHGAEALLLSSDYEGFSLVVAEALACGTPVVSVDCPSGPAEILTGALAEFLVPLHDIKAFADAIRRVLSAPPVIPTEAFERFRLETVVERYLALANRHS